MAWLGNEAFQARLREYIVEPISHSARFEPDAMPVRPFIGVYGHRESDKAQVVAHFCRENMIHAEIVTVRFGFTHEAIKEINRLLLERGPDLAVLIIDHADVLLLEPDDAESQRFALNLRYMAEESGLLFVGCFDRILNGRDAESYARAAIRPWLHALCYLAPPHSAWIASFLQHQLEGYVTRHAATEGFELHLQSNDYIVLAQSCVGASYGHLVAWIRRVWYLAYQTQQKRIDKDWLTTPPLMSVRSGRLHILEEDVRLDESKFSIAVGDGPTASVAAAPAPPSPTFTPKSPPTPPSLQKHTDDGDEKEPESVPPDSPCY